MTEGSQVYPLAHAKERNSAVKTGASVECLARSPAKYGKDNMKRQNGKVIGMPQVTVPKRYVQGIPICPQAPTLA